MQDVVVFNGMNALDFQDIRDNVIRIPEVSVRIQEAQTIWDVLGRNDFSFYNFLVSEDLAYLSNIKLKSIVAAVVQVGLYDRYINKFKESEFIVGAINEDSPLNVCIGKVLFEDLILQSEAAKPDLQLQAVPTRGEPVLSGMSLIEFGVFKKNFETNKYEAIEIDKFNIDKVFSHLMDEFDVKKFINIGPGNLLMSQVQKEISLRDIQVTESVDMDPMLSWFWSQMFRQSTPLSLAN